MTTEKFMMIMKKVALRHKFHLKEEGRAWVNRSFEGQRCFVMRIITSHFITQEEILSFPPPHIATIVQYDYISTTFGHLKFANGLLH